MSSTPTSKINHELALVAYGVFAANRTLTFHINRPRSYLKLPECDAPLMITQELRDECLKHATPKVESLGEYFFNDSKRGYYINQATVDEFTAMTKEAFPNLKFTHLFGVVDTKENVQLMPDTTVPEGFATYEKDHLSLALKVRAWVATEILTPQSPTN